MHFLVLLLFTKVFRIANKEDNNFGINVYTHLTKEEFYVVAQKVKIKFKNMVLLKAMLILL